jgi:hypothetical protein
MLVGIITDREMRLVDILSLGDLAVSRRNVPRSLGG